MSAGMIGGIVGGVVAIAAAFLAFFLLKRRKNQIPDEMDGDPELQDTTMQDATYNGDDDIFVSEYGMSEHAVDDDEVLDEDGPLDQSDGK
jgi:hypothetical protein